MIASIVDWVLSLHGWVALAVVFALPALEASAFLGFIFPGEIGVLLGGVLANEGRVPLAAVVIVAVAGAFIGDTIGYFIGKHFGRKILRGTIGRLPIIKGHLERHMESAQGLLQRRGGAAVFLGRFTTALRVLVPGLAGMSNMAYPRFFAYNAAGGLVWGAGFVLIGYSAGAAWHHVAGVASSAGLVLLAALLLALTLTWIVRDRERHSARLRALVARSMGRPPASFLRRRLPHQAAWLGRRLDPESPIGLALTFVAVAGALCAWVFGALTQDVLAKEETIRLDPRVERFVLAHREGWATIMMKALTWLGSNAVLVPLVIAIGGYFLLRRRDWRPGAKLLAALTGAVVLYDIVKPAVGRLRPPASYMLLRVSGWAFPSGHATAAVAFYGMAAFAFSRGRSAGTRALLWAGSGVIAIAIGASRIYLGVHWFTDVVGGFALGGLWLAILIATLLAAAAVRRPGSPA